jgi:hypothetical protein
MIVHQQRPTIILFIFNHPNALTIITNIMNMFNNENELEKW